MATSYRTPVKIGEIRVLISRCTEGIYLRWYFNGWHYFNFQNGYDITMQTESMGIQVTNFFSVISKIERDTRIKSQYAYQVTLHGIAAGNVSGFTGLLIAEQVEQYEDEVWRIVEITRGGHLIKEEGTNGYILDFEITRKELPDSSSVYQKNLRLYIGDTLCDMDDDEVIPVNKQVNNIAEMQDRQSDFTAQFKIRKTRTMRALFELSGEVGANTLFPYQEQECRVIQDNIEMITNGILILNRVDDQYYYVSISSGNMNFFKTIETLKLSDLTLGGMVHNWNAAFMASTHACTSPNCDIVYPLCEPSDDGSIAPLTDNGDRVEIYGGWIWPFCRVKAIWEEIFENAVYTVTGGNILDSDIFEKLFMPISTRKNNNTDAWLYSMFWGGAHVAAPNDVLGANDFPGTTLILGDDNFKEGWYHVPFVATYTIHVGIITLMGSATLELWNHAAPVGIFEVVDWGIGITNYEIEFDGVTGDELSIRTTAAYYYYFSVNITRIKDALIAYGSDVDPRYHLPQMTQIDFVKMICNLFGLVPEVMARDRKIRFWNYAELYDNMIIARDWSNYLSERDDEVEFKFGDYARSNYLKYKESQDVIKDNGKGNMPIEDETLPEEKDMVQLNVSTCDEVTILEDDFSVDVSRIAFNKWYEDKTDKANSHYDSNESIDPRIVYVDVIPVFSPPDPKSLWIRPTAAPLAGIFAAPSLEIVTPKKASSLKVSFSSLIVYYANISRMLTKTNLRRSKFNLPVYEVAGLKHNIPVYLRQYKAYFYVNKISNYVPGQLCTVELIKL